VACRFYLKWGVLVLWALSLLKPESLAASEASLQFLQACGGGDLGAAKQYLDRGGDVNARGLRGRTGLHEAAYKGHREVVALLLARGAEADVRDDDGKTPLLLSPVNAAEIAEDLLEHGADPDARGWGGETVLHRVSNNSQVISVLLKHGANPNARDGEGRTPLICLAGCYDDGDVANVALLLDHGADPNAADNQGRTALFIVAGEAVRARLSERDPIVDEAWPFGPRSFRAVIGLLRGRGAQPDLVTLTLLGEAAEVKSLLRRRPLP